MMKNYNFENIRGPADNAKCSAMYVFFAKKVIQIPKLGYTAIWTDPIAFLMDIVMIAHRGHFSNN